MKYNSHLNYKKRKRFLLKVRLVLGLLIVVLIAGGVLYYLKYVRDDNVNTVERTTSETTTSVVAPSISIFKTPYYQFQAANSWVEVPNESNASKFVYRSLRSNLIEHELIIYVNQIPANLSANRVLPVMLKNDNTELEPTVVSDHCLKAVGGNPSMNDTDILISGVRLRCDSDSTNYTVMVGLKDGDTVLKMIRPDGTQAGYTIYYTNLRAIPEGSVLTDIVRTFQTR